MFKFVGAANSFPFLFFLHTITNKITIASTTTTSTSIAMTAPITPPSTDDEELPVLNGKVVELRPGEVLEISAMLVVGGL